MKKNKVMRIASILMVAALISTCAISGTFAKYVTKMVGNDNARVAKWGIVLTLEAGDVFASEYQTHDAAAKEAGIEVSVQAAVAEGQETGDKLVAPGTASTDINGGVKASVSGTPEVATRYTLTIEGLKDVFLPAGEGYTDYTLLVKNDEGKYEYGTFDLAKDYAPVKWDLKLGEGENAPSLAAALLSAFGSNADALAAYGLTADGVSFHDAVAIINKINGNANYKKAVEDYLKTKLDGANFQIEVDTETKAITISYDVKPNVKVDYKAELVWKWAFEQENVELGDKCDTLLGNIAAGVATVEGASTEIAAKLTATATQID